MQNSLIDNFATLKLSLNVLIATVSIFTALLSYIALISYVPDIKPRKK